MNLITTSVFVKSVLLAVSAALAVSALFAWSPFSPPGFRHWVRHWGRVREPGCLRCARDNGRIAADLSVEDAFAHSDRRRSADRAIRSNFYLVGVRNRREIAAGRA